MLVISHRGRGSEAPENSLAAFHWAAGSGVDGIETDVRLTADGQVALCHNRHLPDGRPISEATLEEIGQQFGGHVPTLAEALDRFPDLLWIVEIKAVAAVNAAVGVLRGYLGRRRLLVVSFWHALIDEIRSKLDVECGLSIAHCPADMATLPLSWTRGDPQITTVVWKYEFLDELVVQKSQRSGFRNLVWDVESAAEFAHCRAMGIDGVITDHPDLGSVSPVHPQ